MSRITWKILAAFLAFCIVVYVGISSLYLPKKIDTCEDKDYSEKNAVGDMKRYISNYAGLPQDRKYLESLQDFANPEIDFQKAKETRSWIVGRNIKPHEYQVTFIADRSARNSLIIDCVIHCGHLVEDCKTQH